MSSSSALLTVASKFSRRRFLATHSSALAALPGNERCLWTQNTPSLRTCLLYTKNPTNRAQVNHKQQQLRWMSKHQAKMGQHLENLDEMAHEKTREKAEERRHKKKMKKAQKKAKKKGGGAPVEELHGTLHGEEEDIHYEEHDDDEEEEDEDVLPDPDKVKARMMKIVSTFEQSLKSIRGAEPTPEIFDDVVVDAYGSNTPLKAVAQVVIASQTQALATCYDPALAKAVSLAIRDKLSLNPSVEEGGVVKIPIPRVSMESRQKTATLLNKRAESYRQRIRRVRRNVMEVAKKGVAGKLEGISKDDAFRVQKEIEETTDSVIQSLNNIAEKKHDSIMAV